MVSLGVVGARRRVKRVRPGRDGVCRSAAISVPLIPGIGGTPASVRTVGWAPDRPGLTTASVPHGHHNVAKEWLLG